MKWLKSKVPVRMAGLKIFGLTVSILWVGFLLGGGEGGEGEGLLLLSMIDEKTCMTHYIDQCYLYG